MDTLSYEDWLTALTIWREARGESDAARLGVLWVIHNRVANPGFRPSVPRVILQPAAFSSMTNHGDPETVAWPVDAPTTHADWKAFQDCVVLVQSGLGDTDPTSGSVFYESYPIDKLEAIRAEMPWFSAAKLAAQIGRLRFYRA